jgi:glycerol dehydrogenase-like iron-containing ADH family enzyme
MADVGDVITGPAAVLAAALHAAGHQPPVLIVADNAAIARHAPDWARSFAALGWEYRVRLSDGPADDIEAEAIAAEARHLGAHTLIAAGGETTQAATRAGAARTETPCLVLAD